MSFGIFESALSSEQEVGLARQAAVDQREAAIYDVREKLGPSLFASQDLQEFRDRVAMMKNDQSIYKVIEPHIHPSSGVVRSIVGKNGVLEKEFKAKLEALRTAGLLEPRESMRKGAPFAGYSDFDDCTKKNADKNDPNAYCGEIKHKVEGSRRQAGGAHSMDRPMGQGWGGPEPARNIYWEEAGTNELPEGGRHRNEEGGEREARRRRADFDGEVDTKSTFSPSDGELEPDGNFEAYKSTVDQGAESKVKGNFASKMAWALYTDWCEANGCSPRKLASLDAYATNLTDAQYFRLANTVRKASDYTDRLLGPGMDPDEAKRQHHPKTPKGQSKEKLKDVTARRDPLQSYLGWCKANGFERFSARNVAIFGGGDINLTGHLAWRVRRALRTALRRTGSRRTAAPDYLQKADDALTQLLNQKAQEFQETIAPLQQALVTVQQAEQLQQAQNPMNVLPPPGTVNVMPGGDQGPAGLPAPGAQDLGAAAQALAGAGGDEAGGPPGTPPPGGPPPGGAPIGGDEEGGPPPAAGGGGLPPELMQMQGRRRQAYDDDAPFWDDPSQGPKGVKRRPTTVMHPDDFPAWAEKARGLGASDDDIAEYHKVVQRAHPPNPQRPQGYSPGGWNTAKKAEARLAGTRVARPNKVRDPATQNLSDEYDYAKPGDQLTFNSLGELGKGSHPDEYSGGGYMDAPPAPPSQSRKPGENQMALPSASQGQLHPVWKEYGYTPDMLAEWRGRHPWAQNASDNDLAEFNHTLTLGDGRADFNARDFAKFKENQAKGGNWMRLGEPSDQPTGYYGGSVGRDYPGFHPITGEPVGKTGANVTDLWTKWQQQRGQSGNLGIGGDADYDAFANEFKVGPRALNKLRKQHQQIAASRQRYLSWCDRHGLRAASTKNFYWYLGQINTREASLLTARGYSGDHGESGRDPYASEYRDPYASRHDYDPSDSDQIYAPARGHGWEHSSGPSGRPYVRPQGEQGRHEGSVRQAWSGWGPAQFPRTRQVEGWNWDKHLSGYLANAPQRFACECGDSFNAPSGFHRCACGKQWNSYVIGNGGSSREAAADKYIVREIPTRADVIVANRRLARDDEEDKDWDEDNPDHIADDHDRDFVSALHQLTDVGELDDGEDDGMPTFRKPPRDWARRGDGARWQGSPIGA